MKVKFSYLLFTAVFLLLIVTCKHDPVIPPDLPGDTIPIDTTKNDTTQNPVIIPCDPDSIYFKNDIEPFIIATCARSGCHDAITQIDGVNLSNYTNILNEIQPGNAQESKLFKAIYWPDFDPDKLDELMPQNSNTGFGDSLELEMINTIQIWINQGAKNNSCSECDTTNVSFANDLIPIFERSCNTSSNCHASGSGRPIWDDYQTVKNNINKFQVRVIDRSSSPMPPSGSLPNCDIDKLKVWIENGATDN